MDCEIIEKKRLTAIKISSKMQENLQCKAQQAHSSGIGILWSVLEINRIICRGVTAKNDFGIFASATLTFQPLKCGRAIEGASRNIFVLLEVNRGFLKVPGTYDPQTNECSASNNSTYLSVVTGSGIKLSYTAIIKQIYVIRYKCY